MHPAFDRANSARRDFEGTPRRALTVPASAIVRRGQLSSVFVVDQGLARVRLVNLSEHEVLAGLTESEIGDSFAAGRRYRRPPGQRGRPMMARTYGAAAGSPPRSSTPG
jgi:hypothetical protein